MIDNSKRIEELKETYQKEINSNSTLSAIEAVKELVELEPKEWSYHYTLAILYSNLPKEDALKLALEAINTGIGYIGTSPALLALKAEILIQGYDGANALTLIDIAERQYEINESEISDLVTKLELPRDIKSVEDNLKNSQKFLLYLAKLRGQAQILNTGQVFLQRFNDIEQKIESNKSRVVELLGIFSAVVAFVIVSGQVALKFENSHDAIIFISGFGLTQVIFASLISFLSNKSTANILKDLRIWLVLLSIVGIGILLFLTK